jgi:hypothetical protein
MKKMPILTKWLGLLGGTIVVVGVLLWWQARPGPEKSTLPLPAKPEIPPPALSSSSASTQSGSKEGTPPAPNGADQQQPQPLPSTPLSRGEMPELIPVVGITPPVNYGKMPAALLDPPPDLVLNGRQIEYLNSVRRKFMEKYAVDPQNPTKKVPTSTDPAYLEEWDNVTRTEDERYRFMMGRQAYSRMQYEALKELGKPR